MKNPQLSEKPKTFPLKIINKTRMLTLTFIQHSSRSPRHSNERRKRNKRIQLVKEEVKQSLFPGNMVPYKEIKKKNATRKQVKLITKFGKVERYKSKTHNLWYVFMLTTKYEE